MVEQFVGSRRVSVPDQLGLPGWRTAICLGCAGMVKQARHAWFQIGESHSGSGPVELPGRLACPPTTFLPVRTSRCWWELPTVAVPTGHTRAFTGSGCSCLKGGDALGRPAVDINRLVVAIGAVAVAYLFHPGTHREGACQGGD